MVRGNSEITLVPNITEVKGIPGVVASKWFLLNIARYEFLTESKPQNLSSTYDGVDIITDATAWEFIGAGGGLYSFMPEVCQIRAAGSSLCVDVDIHNHTDSRAILLSPCLQLANSQLWQRSGDGTSEVGFFFSNEYNNKGLRGGTPIGGENIGDLALTKKSGEERWKAISTEELTTGVRISRHVLRLYDTETSMQCRADCLAFEHCAAITYLAGRKTCILHGKDYRIHIVMDDRWSAWFKTKYYSAVNSHIG